MTGFPPSTPLAVLYENTSSRGTRYFAGRLGLARIVLLPGEPTEDGTATWKLLVQEAAPRSQTNREPRKQPARKLPARRTTKLPMRVDDFPDDNVTDLWSER